MEDTAMSILKTLIDARAKITERENWLIGIRVAPNINGTYAYCALGAIEAALGVTRSPLDLWHEDYIATCRILAATIENEIDENIHHCVKRFYGNNHVLIDENLIAEYNNRHSHKEVLAWFDRAIASQRLIEGLITIEPARELENAYA
jgi:hypothetical protein